MRGAAAAIVLVCVVAAGVRVGSDGQGGRGSDRPDPADSLARNVAPFESAGVVSDRELAVHLDFLRKSVSGRMSSATVESRKSIVRALGRLERRDLIGPLTELVPDGRLGDATYLGLALTLRANAEPGNLDGEIARAVTSLVSTAPPAILGQLPYSTLDQFQTAETRLARLLEDSQAPRADVARALEALARRNRKLGRLSDETLALLKKGAAWELPAMHRPGDEPIARESFAALMAAGVVDAPLLDAALGEESALYRRLGAFALFGTGAVVSDEDRTRLVRVALEDRDWTVRYDALRAWVRRETAANGCGPIADGLADSSAHLVLAAIDALADRCVTGDEAEPLTGRLVSELRTPPDVGSWHREAHALVAAAKRAPERAALAMPAFRTHNLWQVRMYAARAAEPLKDLFTLEKLAYDDNDNVREAALMPLQRLAGVGRSQPAFIAALGRADYQLVLTAANGLKGQTTDRYVVAALVDALSRITLEKKETSRDIRLALMARIREAGSAQSSVFEKLLKDFDPRIAAEAATALEGLTGVRRAAAAQPLPPVPGPTQREMDERMLARVELDTGRFFEISFDKTVAALAYSRIARLVRAKYYDGLTFHRVVPNFVIQGGSPGANEYAGDARFMRDELSTRPHSRGTVGLSTRGRHTGDAQIFVNLADNRTLDLEYTVIGEVNPAHMSIVDTIQEGTRLTSIRMVPAR
jgi:cyclophilin family peptidyl-prolyl cis-trans isomerase